MKRTKTSTVIDCDNCGRETSDPFTWWEGKTGDDKSLVPVDGWTEKHNCQSCHAFGYRMAEVMG